MCGGGRLALDTELSLSLSGHSASDLSTPQTDYLPQTDASHPDLPESWEGDRSDGAGAPGTPESSEVPGLALEDPEESSEETRPGPAQAPPSQPQAGPSSEELSLPELDSAVGAQRPSLPGESLPMAPPRPQGDHATDRTAAATALNCSEAELGSLVLQHVRRQNGCPDAEDAPAAASPGGEDPEQEGFSPKPSQSMAVQVSFSPGRLLSLRAPRADSRAEVGWGGGVEACWSSCKETMTAALGSQVTWACTALPWQGSDHRRQASRGFCTGSPLIAHPARSCPSRLLEGSPQKTAPPPRLVVLDQGIASPFADRLPDR